MNQEKAITKDLMCICLRNRAEIWVEKERIETLIDNLMVLSENKFIKINNEIINTADIIGILTAQTMEEITRRKNGQWKDKEGNWRNKGDTICPGCGNVLLKGKICGYCQ